MAYKPNPNFYDDQIDEIQNELDDFNDASYSTEKRGYVVNGKTYTDSAYKKEIANRKSAIKKLQADKKKYGRYGPNVGEGAKSNPAGEEFLKLYNAAAEIKVTDFDSAVANYEAWKKVTDFVEQNKDIRVVAQRKADIQGERRTVTRTVKLVIDPTTDEVFQRSLTASPQQADQFLDQYAEQGTVETQKVVKGDNPNTATTSYRKVVVDQAELDRRNQIIDTVRAGRQAPVSTTQTSTTVSTPSTTAATGTTGTTTTTAGTTTRRGGQSAMTPEQTMRAFAGLRNMNEPAGGGTPGGGGAGGGAGTGAGAGGRNVVPRNWEEQFRRMFPNQAWLLDIDRAKYPKLFALIQRGVADRMYESQEGLARFDAELRNTDFYVELRNNDTVRQIKSLVGDLGFDTVPFNKFLTTAANMGWKDETLQQEVYKEAFRKNDAGQYVNPTAVTRAKASNNYLQIANIGKAYFSQVADTTVENALTGVITSEDVQRQQRELAKTKYGHLSNLIDQGFTLEELASPFKQQAAQLLERSPDDINMGDAMFEAAYNYGDTGQKRMMTTGEWEIMLRSDAKYGWDKTQNAKQEARQLASSIAQAFGKVI